MSAGRRGNQRRTTKGSTNAGGPNRSTGPGPRGAGGERSGGGQRRGGPGGNAGRRGGVGQQAARRGGSGRVGPVGPKPSSGRGLGGEQIEGRQAVRELLLAQRRKVYEVQISTELEGADSIEDIVTIATAERVPVRYVARKKLEALARSEAPQGVVAHAAALRETPLSELLQPTGPRLLVALDGVTDPGNFGAIIRNCDGAGVDGIIVPRHRAVHVTPTVAKASAGAIEYANISVVAGLPSALSELGNHDVWRIGLDDAAAVSIFAIEPARLAERCCIILGAEGGGLTRLVRQRCDTLASIPMRGGVSSLNVSAAAAISTYEMARLRYQTSEPPSTGTET